MAGRKPEQDPSGNQPNQAPASQDSETPARMSILDFLGNAEPIVVLDVLGKLAVIPGQQAEIAMRNVASAWWAGAKFKQLNHPRVLQEMGKVVQTTVDLTPAQRSAAMKTIFEAVDKAPLTQDPETIEF